MDNLVRNMDLNYMKMSSCYHIKLAICSISQNRRLHKLAPDYQIQMPLTDKNKKFIIFSIKVERHILSVYLT